VPSTGYFGSTTERQVKRFQAAWHLPVVGFVGPATGAALRSALAGGKPAAKPVAPVAPVVSTDGWAFPVRGPHSYGDDMDRYGAPRSGHTHAGQDILASCGTPLVALRGGTVIDADYGGASGYYIAVHSADTRYDYFYAHLRSPALVRAGNTVRTGQTVGYVGDTGDAVGERRAHRRPAAVPEGLGPLAVPPRACRDVWRRAPVRRGPAGAPTC